MLLGVGELTGYLGDVEFRSDCVYCAVYTTHAESPDSAEDGGENDGYA